MFARTCQECGNIQAATPPSDRITDTYRNAKCRKCKSEALDYGSDSFERDANGKMIKKPSEDED